MINSETNTLHVWTTTKNNIADTMLYMHHASEGFRSHQSNDKGISQLADTQSFPINLDEFIKLFIDYLKNPSGSTVSGDKEYLRFQLKEFKDFSPEKGYHLFIRSRRRHRGK